MVPLLPASGAVERTISGINNHRRFSKDYEYATETSEAFIHLCMIDAMLKRLTQSPLTEDARRQLEA